MRVPTTSVLHLAFNDPFGRSHSALENQSWWEVSDRGPLPALQWQVHAARRGLAVYGLLSNMSALTAAPRRELMLRGVAR
jgi:hypothetical protein